MPIAFDVGTIRGRMTLSAEERFVSFEARAPGAGGISCRASARPDAGGRFEIPVAMAGPGRIGRVEVRADGWKEGPLDQQEVLVSAGGIVEVVVP